MRKEIIQVSFIVIITAILLPVGCYAAQMSSETYAIDAGRISAGSISIPSATSTNYSVEFVPGQELTYTLPTPAPDPDPDPDPGGGVNVIAGEGEEEGSQEATQPTPEPVQKITPVFYTDPDKDGDVDVFDFNILMVNWGLTEVANVADINSDGVVNIFDFNNLMVNWTL